MICTSIPTKTRTDVRQPPQRPKPSSSTLKELQFSWKRRRHFTHVYVGAVIDPQMQHFLIEMEESQPTEPDEFRGPDIRDFLAEPDVTELDSVSFPLSSSCHQTLHRYTPEGKRRFPMRRNLLSFQMKGPILSSKQTFEVGDL